MVGAGVVIREVFAHGGIMEPITNQIRQVIRRLIRAPLFTVVTLLTLAAGVGANTVVFSVLEGVLLKPLPYPRPNELVGVWHTAQGFNIKDLNMSPANYFVYREQGQTFQDIGIYQSDSVSVTGTAEPERVIALNVTDEILPLLSVTPQLGRLFTREDTQPGVPKTAILMYGFWRRKYGSDPAIIGKSIMVDAESVRIIGVLPERFRFLDYDDLAILQTFKFDRSKMHLGNYSYEGLARLKPGVTMAGANADVARMLPIVMNAFPVPPGFSLKLLNDAHMGPNVRPLKQDVVGDIGGVLWVLMGSIGMVLLIACANVANLMLVRVEGRRQELAVRAALGASRGRIAGELMVESILLGLLGGVLGLGLAYTALRVLIKMAPAGLPRINDIGIDGNVLLFTLLVALVASALFGAIPIFKYAGSRLSTGIREGGRANSQSREQHRTRNGLVVVQVALALVLLICSGLMIRTFRALTQVNPGFTGAAELQTFRISIPEAQVKDDEPVTRMEEAILRKIEAIPGVTSAGISNGIPMSSDHWMDPIFVENLTYIEGQLPPLRRFRFVSPGALATLGVPLVAGRDFTWAETYKRLPVAIVSENIAREYWKEPAAALGHRIRVSSTDDWREIVGVVGDVYDDGVSQKPVATAYWPLLSARFESEESRSTRYVAFLVRSARTGSESFGKDLREAVWSINPNLPLSGVHSMDYFYKRSLSRTSFTLVMLGVAGSMALLLGVVGIYGVTAYSVSQRTREIGIRMALGAQTGSLTGMFVRHGLSLTGIGMVAGLAVAIGAVRLMSSLLFKVSPADPVTYATVCASLVATTALASYLPSRRTATVDPVEALRAE
jgi:putative ABC transport system permease protein